LLLLLLSYLPSFKLAQNIQPPSPRWLSIEEPRACKSVCLCTSHQEQILMLNFLAVGHPIMHLSSANSNVTLTLGRGVSWNVMNNLIKLHSRSKRGIIRLMLWPSQVKAPSQTLCLEPDEAVRKCYRSFRGAHGALSGPAICWHVKQKVQKKSQSALMHFQLSWRILSSGAHN